MSNRTDVNSVDLMYADFIYRTSLYASHILRTSRALHQSDRLGSVCFFPDIFFIKLVPSLSLISLSVCKEMSSSLGLGILGMFALQLNPYSPRVSLRVVSFPCLISELKLLHIFPTRTSSSLMSPA